MKNNTFLHFIFGINRHDSLLTDVPGPPLNLEPLDWDKNFVDLKWEPPASTGGAPVLKYIVERKVGIIFLHLSEVRPLFCAFTCPFYVCFFAKLSGFEPCVQLLLMNKCFRYFIISWLQPPSLLCLFFP